jgi:hypothetical protein
MPATDPDKNKPKPGHKHLNITNVPTADLQAIAHAAIDAGTDRMAYIRAMIAAEAERIRSRGKAGKATGYHFEYNVTGIDAVTAEALQNLFISSAEGMDTGAQAGGGYHRVDDDGNPAA